MMATPRIPCWPPPMDTAGLVQLGCSDLYWPHGGCVSEGWMPSGSQRGKRFRKTRR